MAPVGIRGRDEDESDAILGIVSRGADCDRESGARAAASQQAYSFSAARRSVGEPAAAAARGPRVSEFSLGHFFAGLGCWGRVFCHAGRREERR
jgi:hypothetical protein